MSALERLTKVRLENVCSQLYEAIKRIHIEGASTNRGALENIYSKAALDDVALSFEIPPRAWRLEKPDKERGYYDSIFFCTADTNLTSYLKSCPGIQPYKKVPALPLQYVVSKYFLNYLEKKQIGEKDLFQLNLMIDDFLFECAYRVSTQAGAIIQDILKSQIGGRPRDSLNGPKYKPILEAIEKVKAEGFNLNALSMDELADILKQRGKELENRPISTLKKQLKRIKDDQIFGAVLCRELEPKRLLETKNIFNFQPGKLP